MTTTKMVKVNHEDVLVRVVPMSEVKVGDVLVEPECKANKTSMRMRHPYFSGYFATVSYIKVMKKQITAYTDRYPETHLARVTVYVKHDN